MADDSHIPARKAGFYATLGVGAGFPGSPTGVISGQTVGVRTPEGGFRAQSIGITQNEGAGFNGEIGVGYAFSNGARTELTYGYTGQSLTGWSTDLGPSISTSGTYSNSRVLASAYCDIQTKSPFVPYVGGGIGVGFGSYNGHFGDVPGFSFTGSSSTFAYQAKAGVTYLASKNLDIFAEGVYQGNTGQAAVVSNGVESVSVEMSSNNVFGLLAGMRYHF